MLISFAFIDSDQALKDVLAHGSRIAVVLIVALVGVRLINGLLAPVLRLAIRKNMPEEPEVEIEKRIETLTLVVGRTVVSAVSVAAVLTILPEFGLNIAPLIAGVGIVGLAVGFGAQNLVRDMING